MTMLSLGPGLTAVSQDDIYRQLSIFGLSKNGVSSLLKNSLHVPRIHMPNREKLVDIVSLQLAWRAVNRIGSGDFYMPGHPSVTKGRVPSDSRTSITPQEFYDKYPIWISELMYARQLDYRQFTHEMQRSFHRAAERMSFAMSRMVGEGSRRLPQPEPLSDGTQYAA